MTPRAVFAGLAVWLAAAAPAAAETRVALVVGNGGYQHVPGLPNPPNDASDLAQALTSLGFKVTLLLDADRAKFQSKVVEFGKAAVKSDVSMFYYGGHGLTVEGRNYLLPVDAEFHKTDSAHKVEDIAKATIQLNQALEAQTGGEGIHLVFLDACRNDPTHAAQTSGLAPVGDAPGFLIAYSTSPYRVALDGAGRNSPFAHALLDHLATPGLDLPNLMIKVRTDVLAATGGQTPWENSSLTRQFFFAGAKSSKDSPETQLWQLAGEQRDKNLLSAYLQKFPQGAHAADVRTMLASIQAADAPQQQVASLEDDLWKQAFGLRDRSLAKQYIENYPSGAHVQDASALLASLESAEMATHDPAGICERLATHPSDATASVAGVDLQTLADNAPKAIDACAEAARERPDNPHFLALLARATFASGRHAAAIGLYRKAADAGDTRAMVSLATLMESGKFVAKNLPAAYALYEKAVARDNSDAAINLGTALANGIGVPQNLPRALSLFRKASQFGSARATFNLAKIVSDGVAGEKPAESLELFKKAAELGYPGGYRAAALLLDVGTVVPRDVNAAADQLLQCVRADFGECSTELTARSQVWTADTVRALQTRLKVAGYYDGSVDGRSGLTLAPALLQWRLHGAPKKA